MENKIKGIELAKEFYQEFGLPMIEEKFSEVKNRICAGLVGHGSECFGFDDEVSIDHDYEPGFCIWLTEEDEKEFGFKLFRAYRELPKEYKGIKVQDKSIFGSDFKGVHTINEFYSYYLPNGKVPENLIDWLQIEDFYLAEATNGIIFTDPLGKFSEIRECLNNRPEDIRIKKLASSLFYMAQSGQYNYSRCMAHNETAAASICLNDFAKETAKAVYLLNNKYSPYYKWLFKGLEQLDILSDIKNDLTILLTNPYNVDENKIKIENICKKIILELNKQGLSNKCDVYLEAHAYAVNDKVKDGNLRNYPIML